MSQPFGTKGENGSVRININIMRCRCWLAVCLLLGLQAPLVEAAKIFRCVDDKGHVTFQQTPCASSMAGEGAGKLEPSGEGRHFLWRLTSGEATVYLLGSVHFGTDRMYPLPPVIDAAFAKADALVVEVNTVALDPVATARLVAQMGNYQDGSSLREVLGDADWQKLRQAAAAVGIPFQVLVRQKPWFAAMSLAVAALQRSGFDSRWGIDAHFLARASAEGRPVMELETMEEQLRLFDELSLEVQRAMLRQSLYELEHSGEFFGAMLDAWQRGDAAALETLLKAGFEDTAAGREMYEVFLTRRNVRMAQKIERLLAARRTYFVIVGAAHLLGEESILDLLARRGYRADRF